MSRLSKGILVRWVAWTPASILFVLAFFVGEGLGEQGIWPAREEWLGLAFWPVCVVFGLILACFLAGLGGLIRRAVS